MWWPQFICHGLSTLFKVTLSPHWGSTQQLRLLLSPERPCHPKNVCMIKLQSASLTLTHCHWCWCCCYLFLNSLNTWQLRPWAAAALVVFHSSNCHPPLTHLPLPLSSPLCLTIPPIISGFTTQSLLPWNATSHATIKQVVFIMKAQAVWPYKPSRVLYVRGAVSSARCGHSNCSSL